MRQNDLENPMVIGDYYADQLELYDVCDVCGGAIYRGDLFHLIRKGGWCRKICEECSDKDEEE